MISGDSGKESIPSVLCEQQQVAWKLSIIYSSLIPSYLNQLLSCIRNAARQDNGPITPRVGIYEFEDSMLV